MKWLLIWWAAPIAFLGTWYGLSYYDMSFGIFMLTREANDLVFKIYGDQLGLPPETIPPLVLRAIIFDSFLVFAIFAWRRRASIIAWWNARKAAHQASSGDPALSLAIDDNLSNAP